ncbi:50S ribosomal protein L17 [Porphyromonas asaccharolytica]|uniref:Large ribosomal subunit protein bL17 n=1 Tax=Porphyromonas asaccharolytica (strain ATCC 25260 / DSM 20707 / BCRC 10618 / CCUG 7834 / JCM 6326 / LMG 13178 / VPI 4198 / B440) TaxID=879243 RepID=F4KMP4_PORAD|nr:50S ribosomal protein L17 [Porphyromonas asaccharolytica]AEE12295.1 50S ribosomal protein L17 [Porphyromonas asaccharolytica DSM 20707]EFR34267.1 ribosomal protein L17 [Porphyromonas asaccharolytica PR426713P-I]
MRHNKKFNHLGRSKAHREAMLANMASSLIMHKRINTTVAKAKELRKFVEPIITAAKNDTTASRRLAFSYLRDKEAVKELYGAVVVKVGDRPGGYTRILRTGLRLGDNASMCIIELVDFNDNIAKSASAPKSEGKKRTRRSRRGGGAAKEAAQQEAPATEETAQE